MMMDKTIPIKNIYYMLSYAFINLQKQEYKKLETEDFENVADLCAEILYMGISELIKRGLSRVYIEKQECFSTVSGKIDINESLKFKNKINKQLSCIYEDFSINSYLNQILKSVLLSLLKQNIKNKKKNKLRKILYYFKDVEVLQINTIKWNFQYNRNNKIYEMLIGICELVVYGLLQKDSEGQKKLTHFTDKQMEKLYEKFILEYYKKEFRKSNIKEKIEVNSSKIKWGILEDNKNDNFLPSMQSDIMITTNDKILIIDAKYYSKVTQKNIYNSDETLHSHNLYQIFSYVKNKEYNLKTINDNKNVSGMLLYAKTNDGAKLDNTYTICGNTIRAKTLDLNCDFKEIKNQLNGIAKDFLGVSL